LRQPNADTWVSHTNWWKVTAAAQLVFLVRDGDGSRLHGSTLGLLSDGSSSIVTRCAHVRQGILAALSKSGRLQKVGVLKASSRAPDSGTERGSGAAHRPKRDGFRNM
jgi:hypothetical protein